jgi:F-type H+-transporting ATPase subunit epsilon
MSEELSISILSAENEVFKGVVASLVVPGMMGDFMVLKNHGDCISTMRPGFLEVESGTNEKIRFFISGGIIEILNNEVCILVDSSTNSDDIDESKIKKYIKEIDDKLGSEIRKNVDDLELRRNDLIESLKSLKK